MNSNINTQEFYYMTTNSKLKTIDEVIKKLKSLNQVWTEDAIKELRKWKKEIKNNSGELK